MSRTRPAEGPTISLFPFLAVLLCTMGSLLVLLVLFSRSARQGAEATASAELTDLELARDSLRWRLDQLATVRERTAADLAEARLQLAGVEEHTRSLADELEGLERMITQLESAGPRADGAELARLEAALKSARESLDEARARQRTTPAAYAVVPYVGKNGTHRRPLYIECCIDGVFLQPEGVRLSPGDFEGPPGPGNPLACALRAAREHIAKHPDASTDPAAQPYPLLLVRPSGVMAYYAAREAIQSWGSDFGYQLIDEDWTLTFPPRDPALAEVEKRAIAEARERLAWLAEVRPAKTERPVQQYRAATTRGGVVAEGGPSVLGDQSRFEWRNQVAAREGSAGGGLAAGGGRGSGLAAEGVSGAADDGRGRPLAAGGGDGTDDGGDRGDAILGRGTGRNAGVVGAMAGNAAGQATAAAGQTSAGSRDDVPGRSGPADGMAGGSGGQRMGGRYATGSRFGGGSSAGGASGDGDSEGAGGGGGSVSTTALGVPSSTTGGSAGGTSSAGAAGQPAMAAGGTAMPGLAQTGGSSSDGGSASSSATMSFAQARGRNWASLATQDRPVPLTRPIRIECALGELRLLDESGKRVRSRIPIDGDTATAIDPLVKEVHARVSEWGLAGERMFWKPQLVLSATSDGRSRRDDLERLLADSGLDTRHDGHEDEVRSLPPVQPASYLRE